MCCVVTIVLLLGWAFTLLTWPESYRDSTYPLPDWLCAPERKWLRYTLAVLAGIGFLTLAIPIVVVTVRAAVAEPWLTLGIVGVALVGWGIVRVADPPRSPAAHNLDGFLPVRGRWVSYLLIALGLFSLAASWLLLPR
jgi:hypothetical protein